MSLLLLATSESKSHVQVSWKKSSAVVEVTHTLSGIWSLQISPQSLSRYNKLGVYQSFSLSKLFLDPVHRILVHFPLLLVRCKTWCVQVNLIRIFVFLVHRIHNRKEYCLSFLAQNLSSRCQSWICDGVLIDRKSNVINVLEKLFGINTLSCIEGSMGLRPEWRWRARREIISCSDESAQHWNLLLLPPPPAILLFHTSSDQYWELSNLFWRSSFSLQNSIAPSSSRGSSPCRRVFILFATGYA